ncbi:MAG: OmpH family outer membrane protein [Fimbriimonadaceae bacterium]|nr:OmpH family outer membrane protein [Fimbriimonadaceae bacterium]QYK56349.1 MAG: OmpH family outer membrane protein [Fimbriimonadaceae bacterium]
MKNQTFTLVSGWVTAAVLAGIFLGSGFQSSQEKTAVIDLEKVVFESEEGKLNAQRLDQAVASRQGVLDFMRTHRVATAEQARSFKDLSLKTDIAANEKTQLDRIKGDIQSASRDFDALNQKQDPTEEDRNRLRAYNSQFQSTTALLDEWSNQFQQELQTMRDQMITDSGKRANDILKKIAASEGYTVVLASPRTALYGANDLTEKVTKALDAKK